MREAGVSDDEANPGRPGITGGSRGSAARVRIPTAAGWRYMSRGRFACLVAAAGKYLFGMVCICALLTASSFGQASAPTAALTATGTIGPNGLAIVVPTFTNGTPVLTRTTGATTTTLPTPVSGSNIPQRLTATTTYQLSVTNGAGTASATATVVVATPTAGDWTSENNSAQPIMTGVGARSIAFDLLNDSIQYLTASGQIFKTTGGSLWTATAISSFGNSNGLTIGHPNSSVSVWSLGDCDGVLWHSSDGANTWTEVTGTANGLPAMNCNPPATSGTGIVLDLSDGSQSTLYVAFTSGVFRSIDNGASWANVSPPTFAVGETPTELAIADDGTVFLGTSLGDLFKLTAGNWTQLITAPLGGAPPITALSVDPGGTHVVIGGSDGFVRTSSNSGVTFTLGTQLGGGPSTYTSGTGGVTGIVVSPDAVTYAIANHRVFRSTDYGLTFTDETVTGAVPLPDDAYETIVVDPAQPQTVYVVGSALGVYKRTIGTPGAASDPVTLASGLNQPSNIAADLSAGYVYFTDNIDFASGQVDVVYKSGGKLSNVAPGTNLFPGGLLPLTADLLFGTTPSAPAAIGAVLDTNIGASSATTIESAAAGIGARSLTADSNSSPATIYSNRTDGTLQTFALGQNTVSSISIGTATAVTANQMYVPTMPAIALNLYFCGTVAGNPPGLFQMSKAGGTPALLDSNATGPCAFSGNFAYFTVFSSTPTNHIDVRKYDLTNLGQVNVGESTIVSSNVTAVGNSPALATDGLVLYFATPASAPATADATIQQVVLATASAASFATNVNNVGGLALDGKRVYWTTRDGKTTGGKVQSAADRATTTISITNIPGSAVFGGSFTPAYAYSGDGNTSTTSSTPGTCTVSGGIVSFVGVGTCTLTANATATTNFAAATGNAQSFTIGQATTTISISNIPGSAVSGGSFTPTFAYTGDGTTSVTSGTPSTCTVTLAVVNFVGGGTCSLTSHATAGTNYAAVDGSAQSFTIVQQATTTLIVAPASGPYGGTASLNATLELTSGGTGVGGQLVTFSLNGNPVGSATTDGNGFVNVTASIAGINGGTYPGGVTASFAGSANYAASSETNSLTVNQAPTTISISNIPGSAVSGGSFTPTFAYTGGGTTSVTSGTPSTCTVAGAVVNFVGGGTCTLIAHATAGTYYKAVDGIAQSFTIAPAAATLIVSPASGTYGGTASLNATLTLPSSGTPIGGQQVSFSLNGKPVGSAITDGNGFANVSGASIAGINAGTCAGCVTASFAGTTSYAASSGSNLLTVSQATSSVTVSCPGTPQAFTGSMQTPCTAKYTTSDGLSGTLTVSYTNNTNVGTAGASASYAGDANHAGSSSTGSFTISKANQTITLTGEPNGAIFGQGPFTLTASATSGLTVTLSASGNCLLSANSLSLTGVGSCTVMANQGGNGNYNAAPTLNSSFTIGQPLTTTNASASPATVQYSDYTTLTATVSPISAGGQVLTGTVQFSLNGTNVGSPVAINASGVATLSQVHVNLAAGSYPVKAVFISTNANFAGSTGTTSQPVTQENTFILYTGDTIAQVGTTLNLRATVWDSAAAGYPGVNPETGPSATIGDITKMWIAFDIYQAGSCGTGTPSTWYAQVAMTGTAGVGTATTTLGSASEVSYCVVSRLVAGNTGGTNMFYTAPNAQAAGLDFYMNSGQFATGGGWVNDPTGNHGNFGFNARYNSTGSPKGQMVYVYRALYNGVLADFIIKSNALTALQFTGSTYPISSTLQGKANVQIDRASDGYALFSAGNYTFSATVIDSGQNGTTGKQFSLMVYDATGVPYHSVPAGTALQGGNVFVHSK